MTGARPDAQGAARKRAGTPRCEGARRGERQADLDPEQSSSTKAGYRQDGAAAGWAPKGQRCRAAVPRTLEDHHLRRRVDLAGVIAPMLIDQLDGWQRSSSHGANECWHRPCGRAISSSWTICRPIRSPASGTPSKRAAPPCFTCRPTVLTNPIENAFAKLKAHVRKHAARTIDTLEAAAAGALRRFKQAECANFFSHAGWLQLTGICSSLAPSMTVPDFEMSGAVLIARATGIKLGESCMNASTCDLGS